MEKLNLHGTRHKDVRRQVIHLIEDNWNSGKEIEIITGYSNKMRKLVVDVLNEYNLSYEVGQRFDYNKGYLVILMN